MYHEPKKLTKKLNNPSVVEALRIAEKYRYKVEIIRVADSLAFLSMSKPFYKSPYPPYFTSAIRTAKYVEEAFEEYNS